ncbi:MAG: YibE/F family protein [Lachnospiraceae bacterium]|nr:YibE/F family protein [Lachnospiraceae bacterium]
MWKYNQFQKVELVSTQGRDFQKAVVIQVVEDNLQEDGSRTGQQKIMLRMKTGPLQGEMVEATSTNGYLFGAPCEVGMDVVVIESISGDISIHSVYSADREWAVYGFLAVFLLIVCLVGGRKGFLACAGLVFTGICIIYLYIPMIYRGNSPFAAAVLVAALTTLVTMYLIGGWSKKTVSSVLGTVAGVVMAGVSAWAFGLAAGVGGYNVSNIESLMVLEDLVGIRVGELLFSGLLISSLGAVMDVAMSVSSAVFEIHEQNPALSVAGLFRSGMRVGRDMMGTMVNTLILAFAGGAVSTLLLNYAYQLPYLQIINSNNMDIEIMQGISGSIGVVLTVPFVSFVASVLAAGKKETEPDV